MTAKSNFDAEQLSKLKVWFELNANPSRSNIDHISSQLGVASSSVFVWFHRQRNRVKANKCVGLDHGGIVNSSAPHAHKVKPKSSSQHVDSGNAHVRGNDQSAHVGGNERNAPRRTDQHCSTGYMHDDGMNARNGKIGGIQRMPDDSVKYIDRSMKRTGKEAGRQHGDGRSHSRSKKKEKRVESAKTFPAYLAMKRLQNQQESTSNESKQPQGNLDRARKEAEPEVHTTVKVSSAQGSTKRTVEELGTREQIRTKPVKQSLKHRSIHGKDHCNQNVAKPSQGLMDRIMNEMDSQKLRVDQGYTISTDKTADSEYYGVNPLQSCVNEMEKVSDNTHRPVLQSNKEHRRTKTTHASVGISKSISKRKDSNCNIPDSYQMNKSVSVPEENHHMGDHIPSAGNRTVKEKESIPKSQASQLAPKRTFPGSSSPSKAYIHQRAAEKNLRQLSHHRQLHNDMSEPFFYTKKHKHKSKKEKRIKMLLSQKPELSVHGTEKDHSFKESEKPKLQKKESVKMAKSRDGLFSALTVTSGKTVNLSDSSDAEDFEDGHKFKSHKLSMQKKHSIENCDKGKKIPVIQRGRQESALADCSNRMASGRNLKKVPLKSPTTGQNCKQSTSPIKGEVSSTSTSQSSVISSTADVSDPLGLSEESPNSTVDGGREVLSLSGKGSPICQSPDSPFQNSLDIARRLTEGSALGKSITKDKSARDSKKKGPVLSDEKFWNQQDDKYLKRELSVNLIKIDLDSISDLREVNVSSKMIPICQDKKEKKKDRTHMCENEKIDVNSNLSAKNDKSDRSIWSSIPSPLETSNKIWSSITSVAETAHKEIPFLDSAALIDKESSNLWSSIASSTELSHKEIPFIGSPSVHHSEDEVPFMENKCPLEEDLTPSSSQDRVESIEGPSRSKSIFDEESCEVSSSVDLENSQTELREEARDSSADVQKNPDDMDKTQGDREKTNEIEETIRDVENTENMEKCDIKISDEVEESQGKARDTTNIDETGGDINDTDTITGDVGNSEEMDDCPGALENTNDNEETAGSMDDAYKMGENPGDMETLNKMDNCLGDMENTDEMDNFSGNESPDNMEKTITNAEEMEEILDNLENTYMKESPGNVKDTGVVQNTNRMEKTPEHVESVADVKEHSVEISGSVDDEEKTIINLSKSISTDEDNAGGELKKVTDDFQNSSVSKVEANEVLHTAIRNVKVNTCSDPKRCEEEVKKLCMKSEEKDTGETSICLHRKGQAVGKSRAESVECTNADSKVQENLQESEDLVNQVDSAVLSRKFAKTHYALEEKSESGGEKKEDVENKPGRSSPELYEDIDSSSLEPSQKTEDSHERENEEVEPVNTLGDLYESIDSPEVMFDSQFMVIDEVSCSDSEEDDASNSQISEEACGSASKPPYSSPANSIDSVEMSTDELRNEGKSKVNAYSESDAASSFAHDNEDSESTLSNSGNVKPVDIAEVCREESRNYSQESEESGNAADVSPQSVEEDISGNSSASSCNGKPLDITVVCEEESRNDSQESEESGNAADAFPQSKEEDISGSSSASSCNGKPQDIAEVCEEESRNDSQESEDSGNAADAFPQSKEEDISGSNIASSCNGKALDITEVCEEESRNDSQESEDSGNAADAFPQSKEEDISGSNSASSCYVKPLDIAEVCEEESNSGSHESKNNVQVLSNAAYCSPSMECDDSRSHQSNSHPAKTTDCVQANEEESRTETQEFNGSDHPIRNTPFPSPRNDEENADSGSAPANSSPEKALGNAKASEQETRHVNPGNAPDISSLEVNIKNNDAAEVIELDNEDDEVILVSSSPSKKESLVSNPMNKWAAICYYDSTGEGRLVIRKPSASSLVKPASLKKTNKDSNVVIDLEDGSDYDGENDEVILLSNPQSPIDASTGIPDVSKEPEESSDKNNQLCEQTDIFTKEEQLSKKERASISPDNSAVEEDPSKSDAVSGKADMTTSDLLKKSMPNNKIDCPEAEQTKEESPEAVSAVLKDDAIETNIHETSKMCLVKNVVSLSNQGMSRKNDLHALPTPAVHSGHTGNVVPVENITDSEALELSSVRHKEYSPSKNNALELTYESIPATVHGVNEHDSSEKSQDASNQSMERLDSSSDELVIDMEACKEMECASQEESVFDDDVMNPQNLKTSIGKDLSTDESARDVEDPSKLKYPLPEKKDLDDTRDFLSEPLLDPLKGFVGRCDSSSDELIIDMEVCDEMKFRLLEKDLGKAIVSLKKIAPEGNKGHCESSSDELVIDMEACQQVDDSVQGNDAGYTSDATVEYPSSNDDLVIDMQECDKTESHLDDSDDSKIASASENHAAVKKGGASLTGMVQDNIEATSDVDTSSGNAGECHPMAKALEHIALAVASISKEPTLSEVNNQVSSDLETNSAMTGNPILDAAVSSSTSPERKVDPREQNKKLHDPDDVFVDVTTCDDGGPQRQTDIASGEKLGASPYYATGIKVHPSLKNVACEESPLNTVTKNSTNNPSPSPNALTVDPQGISPEVCDVPLRPKGKVSAVIKGVAYGGLKKVRIYESMPRTTPTPPSPCHRVIPNAIEARSSPEDESSAVFGTHSVSSPKQVDEQKNLGAETTLISPLMSSDVSPSSSASPVTSLATTAVPLSQDKGTNNQPTKPDVKVKIEPDVSAKADPCSGMNAPTGATTSASNKTSAEKIKRPRSLNDLVSDLTSRLGAVVKNTTTATSIADLNIRTSHSPTKQSSAEAEAPKTQAKTTGQQRPGSKRRRIITNKNIKRPPLPQDVEKRIQQLNPFPCDNSWTRNAAIIELAQKEVQLDCQPGELSFPKEHFGGQSELPHDPFSGSTGSLKFCYQPGVGPINGNANGATARPASKTTPTPFDGCSTSDSTKGQSDRQFLETTPTTNGESSSKTSNTEQEFLIQKNGLLLELLKTNSPSKQKRSRTQSGESRKEKRTRRRRKSSEDVHDTFSDSMLRSFTEKDVREEWMELLKVLEESANDPQPSTSGTDIPAASSAATASAGPAEGLPSGSSRVPEQSSGMDSASESVDLSGMPSILRVFSLRDEGAGQEGTINPTKTTLVNDGSDQNHARRKMDSQEITNALVASRQKYSSSMLLLHEDSPVSVSASLEVVDPDPARVVDEAASAADARREQSYSSFVPTSSSHGEALVQNIKRHASQTYGPADGVPVTKAAATAAASAVQNPQEVPSVLRQQSDTTSTLGSQQVPIRALHNTSVINQSLGNGQSAITQMNSSEVTNPVVSPQSSNNQSTMVILSPPHLVNVAPIQAGAQQQGQPPLLVGNSTIQQVQSMQGQVPPFQGQVQPPAMGNQTLQSFLNPLILSQQIRQRRLSASPPLCSPYPSTSVSSSNNNPVLTNLIVQTPILNQQAGNPPAMNPPAPGICFVQGNQMQLGTGNVSWANPAMNMQIAPSSTQTFTSGMNSQARMNFYRNISSVQGSQ